MSKHKNHSHENRPRREQFTEPVRRPPLSWNAVIIAAAAVFLGVVILVASRGSSAGPGTAPSARAISTGTDLTIDASTLADGRAQFFRYVTASNREVRLFVMRSADGVVRAALDACTVCFQKGKGYRQAGDAMVCNECRKSFRSMDINVITGGCNPIPVERTLDADRVIVQAAALEQGAAYF